MKHPNLAQVSVGLAACLALAGGARKVMAHEGHGAMGEDHQFEMMDANGDGKVTPEEHAAGAKKMFEMMDADKDGKVTAAEMDAAHERMMGQKDPKNDGTMEPKGGAGRAAVKTAPEKHGMSAAEKIKVVDGNGDGVLTAEEHAAGAKKMFEKMDADHDGTLTKAELAAGHAKMMHKAAK
jgi:Ca2+-binding EF-hand superfamily protein